VFNKLLFGQSNHMLLAVPDQMVLFDSKTHTEALQVPASLQRSAVGEAFGLAFILVSWLPIALLFWFLT
jgi:hypothetical protein